MAPIKKIPQRKCLGCGEMKQKNELIRIIKTLDNIIGLDKTGKVNGRGAYICKNSECLKKAMKSKGLERSLKTTIPDDIYNNLIEEISKIEQQ